MRWYDVEPDVYMAISLIECSELPKQVEYAKLIIDKLKERDTEMEFIKNTTISNLGGGNYRRWYDKHETVSLAFQYLKNANTDLQKEIAKEILVYMNIAATTFA